MDLTFGIYDVNDRKIALAAHLLSVFGRDLWSEALTSPPAELTKEARIAVGAIVAAKLAHRSPLVALDNLNNLMALEYEAISWENFGIPEAPTQSAEEARTITYGALVAYAQTVLEDFNVSLAEMITEEVE